MASMSVTFPAEDDTVRTALRVAGAKAWLREEAMRHVLGEERYLSDAGTSVSRDEMAAVIEYINERVDMDKYAYATIRGTVHNLIRLPNSPSGNPRWEVIIKGADGENFAPVKTAPDSDLGQHISDAKYRVMMHTFFVTKDGFIGERP